MMAVLAWDVETTGLVDFRARSHDPNQPHLVQLALVEYDEKGAETRARSVIIKPDGWTIPEEMTAIHGISHERACAEGIPEDHAVGLFLVAQARAVTKTAHNAAFDNRCMRVAMTRAGYQRDFIEAVEGRDTYCTCNAAKPIVNLPPTPKMIAANFRGPKAPSLAEAMKHFFGEEIDGAHDALVDARCAGRLYFHLKTLQEGTPA